MTYMNFSLKMYFLIRLNLLQFWVLKRNAAIVGNYIEKAKIYTVPADSTIFRKIFLFTVQTTGCSKIQTIEELAKYQEIYPEFNSICSNQALVSDLIVRMLCPSVPLAQNWKPGVKARTLKKNWRALSIILINRICSTLNTMFITLNTGDWIVWDFEELHSGGNIQCTF